MLFQELLGNRLLQHSLKRPALSSLFHIFPGTRHVCMFCYTEEHFRIFWFGSGSCAGLFVQAVRLILQFLVLFICCRLGVAYIFFIVLNTCFDLLHILSNFLVPVYKTWASEPNLPIVSSCWLLFQWTSLCWSSMTLGLLKFFVQNSFNFNAGILCHIERFEKFKESKKEWRKRVVLFL